MDIVKKVTEFIKSKGKASQKAMVALSGQVGRVGWKSRQEPGHFQGILNLWVGRNLGSSGGSG